MPMLFFGPSYPHAATALYIGLMDKLDTIACTNLLLFYSQNCLQDSSSNFHSVYGRHKNHWGLGKLHPIYVAENLLKNVNHKIK